MGWSRIPVLDGDGDLAGLIPARTLRQVIDNGEEIDPGRATIDVPEMPGTVAVSKLLAAIREHHAVIHRAEEDEARPGSWFALVTAADLNRPLFRAAVYTVIALLETSFGELLMEEFADDWSAIRLLSDGTEARVREFWEEAKEDGLDLSPIVQITLSDMFFIAGRSRNVWRRLGFGSPEALEPVGRRINDVRNRVMHPVQPLIHHDGDVGMVHDAVRDMVAMTERIQAEIVETAGSAGAS
jgi:hypothetical protein